MHAHTGTHTQTGAHRVSSHIAHISLCCLSVSGCFIVIESLRHVFHFRLLHATLPSPHASPANLTVSSCASHTLPCLSFGHITFYCPLYLPQYASNIFDYRATYALPQRGVLLQYQQLGFCGYVCSGNSSYWNLNFSLQKLQKYSHEALKSSWISIQIPFKIWLFQISIKTNKKVTVVFARP